MTDIAQALLLIGGAATGSGGATWLVMQVHVKYLTRNQDRHEQRLNDHSRRLGVIERGVA